MSDKVPPHSSFKLNYHQPPALVDRVIAAVRKEHIAIAIALCGFAIARVFGESEEGRFGRAAPLIIAWLGALVLIGGTVAYVVLRVRSRTSLPKWMKIQLVASTALCLVGAFAMVSFAHEAREGPSGWQYWLTYNQTYAYNPLRAIMQGWLIAAGVAWFVAVLAVDRYRRPRAALSPAP